VNCPNCGRPAPAGDRFCGGCGAALAAPDPTSTPTSEAPAATVTHPLGEDWAPAPPPAPRRRFGPALLAAAMGVALLFGSVGLVAARAVGAHANGASTPEAAATGLLDAINRRDLTRAASYLHGEERQLLTTYHDRLNQLLAGQGVPTTSGNPLSTLDLTTRDVRFQRVDGSRDVAVLEPVSGTVGIRGQGGARIEVPLAQAKDQLAKASGGKLTSLRLVTIRSGGHWYVDLLATGAELGRLANGGARVDYASLTATASNAAAGASTPEAAVRDVISALATNPTQALERLVPDERAVLHTYAAALRQLKQAPSEPIAVEGLTTRTERVASDVTKVYLTGGRVRGSGGEVTPLPGLPNGLGASGERQPYAVAVEQNGSWYPSLLFTATDYALSTAQQEQS
jgi:hypothetical protein